MEIKVGCCGFTISKSKYYEKLNLVEIQQTFYKLIEEKTLEKWRKEAPKNFEFTIKAFQGLTHTTKSPTWKRSGFDKQEIKKIEKYVGELKINKVTLEFWNKMLNYAKILNSKIILLQLPNSFKDSEENVKRVKEFLKNVQTKGINIAIELRGWRDEKKKKIFEEFDVIDVVDININYPIVLRDLLYTRLHGKYENGKIIYNHEYSNKELKTIKNKIEKLNTKENYILFNNYYMFKNAIEFLNI
ncbi:MAG: DUF72 domain-containing protein [Candidatus Aenigmatarchaeota archaeon]